ncbi:MAG: apolipoprotein N-acyltransferase [Bdellovibrionales bacterium]
MTHFLNHRYFSSLLCFLSGCLCAVCMAPYNIWPVFIIGFAVLYYFIHQSKSYRGAFCYGWLWAFGYFLFSLYWVGNALLVDDNPYKWAWPLAVCGLPALLSFFNGLACLFAKRFMAMDRWHGYLGFVSILSLSEFARGHLFTGFPWNLYGYSWIGWLDVAQIAALESIYFLTFLTLFWLSFLGFFMVCKAKADRFYIFVIIVISFACSLTFGHFALKQDVTFEETHIKIVQPNTKQSEKWQRDKMHGHFQVALNLSQSGKVNAPQTLIIWPETTLSPAFFNAPYYRQSISDMLGAHDNAVLMTGALRRESDQYFNSLVTLGPDDKILHIYNKSHLVPFGEYIPFQNYIPIPTVTQFSGFEKGGGPKSLSLFDSLAYSPLICYEILFPGKAVPEGNQNDDNVDFIVNVTNDAWYGTSPGPWQHLTKAQFRAIEEGKPVLRAANTGVSAIIDPYGRFVMHTNLFEAASLEHALPAKSVYQATYIPKILLFPLLPLAFVLFALFRTTKMYFFQKRNNIHKL